MTDNASSSAGSAIGNLLIQQLPTRRQIKVALQVVGAGITIEGDVEDVHAAAERFYSFAERMRDKGAEIATMLANANMPRQ